MKDSPHHNQYAATANFASQTHIRGARPTQFLEDVEQGGEAAM
ncbi:MAG: hypothetical protein ACI8QF_002460 [Limisphaerales bacterium]|jgi:hypothetical protein